MEYIHWAEDDVIAPAQTVYLSGCNLGCAFCQTREEAGRLPSVRLTPERFGAILRKGLDAGVGSIDVLGGEPGVNLPALLELFAEVGDFPGLVWNTNLYIAAEALRLLDGVVDVYLADIKFGNPGCAEALSGRRDASEVAWRLSRELYSRSPEALVIRHLVVPGHWDCCTRPVLEAVRREMPGVRVSLRTGYMPPRDMPPGMPENRFPDRTEALRAVRFARDLPLRLTGDPELVPGVDSAASGSDVEFEIAVTPAGDVHMRHVTREAVDLLAAAGFGSAKEEAAATGGTPDER
jgi:putative pyruvate formate lyase activating enzyme